MRYIKSKYNSLVDTIDDGVLILNTFTSSILWVPNEYWEQERYIGELNDEWKQLIDSGVFVDETRNEYQELEKYLQESISCGITTLRITIAPTYACNMKCDYCFQSDSDTIVIPKKTADKVYDSIVSIATKYKSLVISWFGGEPLLAMETVTYLSSKLIQFCDDNNIHYMAELTTNGTLLTEDTASLLVKLRVREVQITLDGKDHDSTRKMKDGSSSYDLIVHNISKVADKFSIILRSNITNDNLLGVKKMIDELMLDFSLQDKLYFSFYPVSEFGGKSHKNCNFDKFCNFNVFELNLVELIKYVLQYVDARFLMNLYQTSSSVPCEAIFKDVVCFDAHGDVYKCSLAMQNVDPKIGNINENNIDYILGDGDQNGWLTFSWADECKECNFLPMCHSGCFFQRRASGKNKICDINIATHKQIARLLYDLMEESI